MSQLTSCNRCPSCGAAIPQLTFVCAYCGFGVARPKNETAPATAKKAGLIAGFFGGDAKSFQEPDSPEGLVAFFSEHIGGVSTPSLKTDKHKRACESALTKLKAFSAHDARLAQVTLRLQEQYNKACAEHRRSNFKLILIGVAALLLFFAFAGYMAYNQASGRARAREDVQKLIGEGKYDEARIRAQDLRYKSSINEMLELIDKAEKNARDQTK